MDVGVEGQANGEGNGGGEEGRGAWGRGRRREAELQHAEVVVVAPRWWAGGQPPPKIKMQNYRPVGFLETKMGLEVTGSKRLPLLEFLGGGFGFLGISKAEGWG